MIFRETPADTRRLPRFERRSPGVADLLEYDVVLADGVIGLKGDGFLAGFRFRGPDPEAADGDALAAFAERVEHALGELGSGWVLHLDYLRQRAPSYPCSGTFSNAVSKLVDDDRRRRFEASAHFTSRALLWLAWYPPRSNDPSAFFVRSDEHLAAFETGLADVVGKLDPFCGLTRLDTVEALGRLEQTIHGNLVLAQPPAADAFLDTALATSLVTHGDRLQTDHAWFVPLRLATLPTTGVLPDALGALGALTVPFRYALRLIFLDPWDAEAAIARIRNRWEMTAFSWSSLWRSLVAGRAAAREGNRQDRAEGKAPERAVHHRQVVDANAALEAAYGGRRFVYATPILLAMGTTLEEADRHAAAILARLKQDRLLATVDRHNARQAYFGSLPGCAWLNARRFLQPLSVATALAPLTATWQGAARSPHPRLAGEGPLAVVRSSQRERFCLNLFSAADGYGDLGHASVIGPSGAGKSVLLNFLAGNALRYPGARVIALDVDRSQLAHCLAVGGTHYDTGSSGVRFAPLFTLRDGSAAGRAYALDWLMHLWDVQHDEPMSDAGRQHLAQAVDEVAALDAGFHDLSTLRLKLQSQALRLLLRPYCGDGEYAHLLDGNESPIARAEYLVIELRPLLGMRPEVTTPVFAHLLQLIRSFLDGTPTWILIDEGSHILSNPILKAGVGDFLVTLRKHGGSVVFATQSLAHFADSALRQVFEESCPTTIYLPNPQAARSREVRAAYRAAGLTEAQIDLVAHAIPKRDYVLIQPDGQRVVNLVLSPLELAFYGVSDPTSVRRIEALRQRDGDGWVAAWLAECGLAVEAQALHTPAPNTPAPHTLKEGSL